jgi:hypothetical protein
MAVPLEPETFTGGSHRNQRTTNKLPNQAGRQQSASFKSLQCLSSFGLVLVASFVLCLNAGAATPPYQLAFFSADVTIPLNHRCMGVLPTKSKVIADPLYAKGFVLLGEEAPVVLCAVDWCEIRNAAYDQWRNSLAIAAKTTPERVMVCSLHQHDAPVTDAGAAKLLEQVGLKGELYDEAFHARAVATVAGALKTSLLRPQAITHIGTGQATVNQIASNRRVINPDGRISYTRGSRSGGTLFHRESPTGLIDPNLKTISFWNQNRPVLALHAYATHPMSSYGAGQVSSDFVGLARQRRQQDHPQVPQIYVSGCSGDVTAGKWNNGSAQHRKDLIDRLYNAMVKAWDQTERKPIKNIAFRNTSLNLQFHPGPHLTTAALRAQLDDTQRTVEKRILAAMGLASRMRVESGKNIDLPCLDLGFAQLVLFPGETFVAYQLMTQELRPDSFVMCIGYGESWTGYIPTDQNFDEHFEDSWLWVAPGSEQRIMTAVEKVLTRP